MSFRSYGDPYLPTVVLLMGLGMPAAAWPEEFIRKLVQKGLRVVTPDNRDSGDSEKFPQKVSSLRVIGAVVRSVLGISVDAPYRLEDMAADVEQLLDDLGVARAHVAGISMGGMIAQVLATRAPHRVISLTCLSSASGNPKTGLGNLSAVCSVVKRPPYTRNEEQMSQYYRHLFQTIGTRGNVYSDQQIHQLIEAVQTSGIDSSASARHLLAVLASGNRCSQLRQISTPTLVIHGTRDPLLPIAAGREVAQCIKNARLMEVEGMGHDLPLRQVDRLAEAIADHCYSETPR